MLVNSMTRSQCEVCTNWIVEGGLDARALPIPMIECERCGKLCCIECVRSLESSNYCSPFVDLQWTCIECIGDRVT